MRTRALSDWTQSRNAKSESEIRANADLRNRVQLRIPIALDTASTPQNPFYVQNPFDGFYVESATDTNTTVNLSFTSPELSNINNFTVIRRNDSAKFDSELRGAYLTWPAQPGKTMVIVFYLGVAFSPGSLIQTIAGGVVMTSGTGMTSLPSVQVTATASLILASDTTRKRATFTNLSGSTVYISGTNAVVGNAGLGSLTGLPIPVGGSYEISHTGAVYAITDAGTATVALNVEA